MNKLDQISREVGDNWPRHADGRGKRFGEMTDEQKQAVMAGVTAKLKAELEHPAMAAAVMRDLPPQTPTGGV